mgnify:CR=1 FL=1
MLLGTLSPLMSALAVVILAIFVVLLKRGVAHYRGDIAAYSERHGREKCSRSNNSNKHKLPEAYCSHPLMSALAVVILAIFVVLLAIVVGKVYEAIILHNGNRIKMGDIFKMAVRKSAFGGCAGFLFHDSMFNKSSYSDYYPQTAEYQI